MKPLPAYVKRALLDDLWGEGFTVVPRHRDPLHVPPEIVPHGMSYQWNLASDHDVMVLAGWVDVDYTRHPGLFGPYGFHGPVTHGGLVLMEKPGAHEAERKRQIEAVRKQEGDWAKRFEANGIEGGARVVEPGGNVREIGTPFAQQATKIPRELMGRVGELFGIRDQIIAASPPELMNDPRVRAAATDIAIIALQTKPTGA